MNPGRTPKARYSLTYLWVKIARQKVGGMGTFKSAEPAGCVQM